MNYKESITCFFIVSIFAVLINEYNVNSIKILNPQNVTDNSGSLVHGYSVFSIDNYWYTSQIKHLLDGNGFTVNPLHKNYSVRRTPVYPLFYGIHYMLFGERESYFWIRFTQILLFALAAVALLHAVYNFTGSKPVSVIAVSLYAFNPSVVIYLYHTITESLSISLICYVFFAISLCVKYKTRRYFFLLGASFGLVILCRPPVFLLFPSIAVTLIVASVYNVKKVLSNGIVFMLGLFVFVLPWTVRNYKVTNGDIIILEKYYGDPMEYGMPNVHLRQWIACWMNPADFTSERISNHMIHNIQFNEPVSKTALIDSLIQSLPEKAFMGSTRVQIVDAYSSLYDYYYRKNENKDKDQFLINQEKIASQKIIKIRTDFVNESPFTYYVTTPILFIKSLVFQSNSGTLVFLRAYLKSVPKYIAKLVLYLLNISAFLSVLIGLFYVKRYKLIYSIALIFSASTLVVFIYKFRYFEARYLLPLFPFLYTILAVCIVEVYRSLRKRLHF